MTAKIFMCNFKVSLVSSCTYSALTTCNVETLFRIVDPTAFIDSLGLDASSQQVTFL